MGFRLSLGSISGVVSAGNAVRGDLVGKPKRRKFGVGALIVSVVLGMLFIVLGLFVINFTKVDPSWIQVTGKVTDAQTYTDSDGNLLYAPICQYTVDGKAYTIESGSSSSVPVVIGGACKLAYNPANPKQAQVDPGIMGAIVWIFPVAGTIIILFGIIKFVSSRKRTKMIGDLMTTGRKVTGVLTGIKPTVMVNGVQHYKLIVSADNGTGTVSEFVSDTIVGGAWVLATADYTTRPIPIDVYFDQVDPSRYYVDISSIQGLTPEKIQQMTSRVDSAPGPISTFVPAGTAPIVASTPPPVMPLPLAPTPVPTMPPPTPSMAPTPTMPAPTPEATPIPSMLSAVPNVAPDVVPQNRPGDFAQDLQNLQGKF